MEDDIVPPTPMDAMLLEAMRRIHQLEEVLRESKRSHHRGYNDESCDYPPCPKSDEDAPGDAKCTCAADEWNEKVEKVLNGQ